MSTTNTQSYYFIGLEQAEYINATGAIKGNLKPETNVLGNIRSCGNVGRTSSNLQREIADIPTTIQGQDVKIEIKCKSTVIRYQSEVQKCCQKQIEDAGAIYIAKRTIDGFYNYFNLKSH